MIKQKAMNIFHTRISPALITNTLHLDDIDYPWVKQCLYDNSRAIDLAENIVKGYTLNWRERLICRNSNPTFFGGFISKTSLKIGW